MKKEVQSVAYTYMVECSDGSLYTGWTNNLEKRVRCHNKGTGAKYTKTRLPVRLVYYEVYTSKSEAMKREYAIKQLNRRDKLVLLDALDVSVKEHCLEIMDRLCLDDE